MFFRFSPVASAIAKFTEDLVLYYCSRSSWKSCEAVEAAVCFATARSCGERCLADALGSYVTLAWSMCFRYSYCGLSDVTAIAKFPLHRGAFFFMVSLSLSLINFVNLTHVLLILFLYVKTLLQFSILSLSLSLYMSSSLSLPPKFCSSLFSHSP